MRSNRFMRKACKNAQQFTVCSVAVNRVQWWGHRAQSISRAPPFVAHVLCRRAAHKCATVLNRRVLLVVLAFVRALPVFVHERNRLARACAASLNKLAAAGFFMACGGASDGECALMLDGIVLVLVVAAEPLCCCCGDGL